MTDFARRLLRLVILFVATMAALIGILGGYASASEFRAAAGVASLYFTIPVLVFVVVTTRDEAPSIRFGDWLIAAIGIWPALRTVFTWVAEGNMSADGAHSWASAVAGLLWSVVWIATRPGIFRTGRDQ